jgi:hypothetical protein
MEPESGTIESNICEGTVHLDELEGQMLEIAYAQRSARLRLTCDHRHFARVSARLEAYSLFMVN